MSEIMVDGQDVTLGVLLLMGAARRVEDFDLDEEEVTAVLSLCDAVYADEANRLAERVRGDIERALEAQRSRDEYARTNAQRAADQVKAAAQLAAEMREREPGLVRAGWTDAQLVELHRMRNAGRA